MKKTASEIEADIYKLIKNSFISRFIKGDVYREGLRPANSQKEDVIVSFLTGIFDTFSQEGKVNINIYVPDRESSGINRKDIKRCREIEQVCQLFAENITLDNYHFKLSRMIQSFSEENINQHFVNMQLTFKYNFL
ncbi:hypothetical protein [Capnocytophaga catalasegens]|uniref:Na+-translocating membrane potential-generating system MpsC domain-containing protein n=1 Tax=Capnocytophaga catalasegens TaxID=1004260 RepID=A0AAV5ARB4_9FLAO|nr:hypothetical protein [Capnocytophaga catalasegens]GIZ15499.1 hypothetical protein RCZ03_14990 [Capnocytophaga catalasegens]GJM49842.1 hypothetical protein RCZ15_08170 [Capnocytophaga catalasegens]GJM54014.1 hypothetical protein RCZ16_23300 [Capnocytophaga catalasegens]